MRSTPSIHTCRICGKAVELKTCKTDEHGHAVHERCYADNVALANSPHTQPRQD